MRSRSTIFAVILMLSLIFLTACGPDLGDTLPDPEGEESGENADLTDQQQADLAAEGSASLHYHYVMNQPYLAFRIEPVIPIAFVEDTPGIWSAGGTAEIPVNFRISGDDKDGICNVHCQAILRFSADGEFQLDPNTGACTLPMSIVFQPQADEWIMETDCDSPSEAVVDCAALSVVMMDPSVYPFKKGKMDPDLSKDSSVTLRAELKDVRLPAGMQGVCGW